MQDNRTSERKLPIGISEFDTLLKDLKDEYKDELPTLDEDTLKFVLASTIMHLGPTDSHKTLEFFYKTIVAGASKQVSHFVFQDVKLRQQEKQKAEEEAKKQPLEATSNTPLTLVASNELSN